MTTFIFITFSIYRNTTNEYCGTSVGGYCVKMKIMRFYSATIYRDQTTIRVATRSGNACMDLKAAESVAIVMPATKMPVTSGLEAPQSGRKGRYSFTTGFPPPPSTWRIMRKFGHTRTVSSGNRRAQSSVSLASVHRSSTNAYRATRSEISLSHGSEADFSSVPSFPTL